MSADAVIRIGGDTITVVQRGAQGPRGFSGPDLTDLAASDGADAVGYAATGRTVGDKLREQVSLADYPGGGVADDAVEASNSGTNNFDAMEWAFGLPRPIVVDLPRSASGTGIYLLDGTTAHVDGIGVTLNPAPGVSIYIKRNGTAITPYNGAPQVVLPGLKTTGDLRINYGNLRYQETLTSRIKGSITDVGRPASPFDARVQQIIPLDFDNDATHWQLSAWPNGVWALADPQPTKAADAVIWGQPPSGVFVASMFAVAPGDFIQARLYQNAGYMPAIAIFTATGWVLVRQTRVGVGSLTTLTFSEKDSSIGSSTVETATEHAVISEASYRFKNALVGIGIIDQRSFVLTLNGVVIKRFWLKGNIQRAGWAGGFGTAGIAAADPPGLFFADPSMIKDKRTFGLKQLNGVGCGDSNWVRTVQQQSPYDATIQAIAGVGGCQLTITNIAASGNTSAQQLTALTAADLEGVDFVVWPPGTNDIQTAVAAEDYIANTQDAVDICAAAGVPILILPPPMFYSQAEAQTYNQDGGAASNSENGSSIRSALYRLGAQPGVRIALGAFEAMGALVPSLIPLKNSGTGDQALRDNIHWTAWVRDNVGEALARDIVALFMHADQHDFPGDPNGEAIPLPADMFITNVGTTATPQLTFEGRQVTMDHALSVGTTIADATTAGTFERRFWPKADVFGPLVNLGAASVPMSAALGKYRISAVDGTIKLWGVDASAVAVAFGGASWKI